MRYAARRPSGTFLWSALLPSGKETALTGNESGQGGYVPDGLSMYRGGTPGRVLWVSP